MSKPLPEEGGVFISRRILRHSVFDREDYLQAWLFLLLMANNKPRTAHILGQAVELKRGQLAWSFNSLKRQLDKGKEWMEAFAEFCRAQGMITTERYTHGTVITIVNYDAYNPIGAESNPPAVPPTNPPTHPLTEQPTPPHGEKNAVLPGQPPAHPQQSVENGDRRGSPSGFGEIPDDAQVKAFCESYTDLARGITSIPEIWWMGWLANALSRQNFPGDWKRALRLAFVADWNSGHPKARGIKMAGTPAPGQTSSLGGPKHEKGEILQLIALAKKAGEPAAEIERLRKLLEET